MDSLTTMGPFKILDCISHGLEIQHFGDGSSSHDHIYIAEILNGTVCYWPPLSLVPNYDNIGEGSGSSLKDFIDLMKNYTGKEPTICILTASLAACHTLVLM